jgi:hypothetical protein
VVLRIVRGLPWIARIFIVLESFLIRRLDGEALL